MILTQLKITPELFGLFQRFRLSTARQGTRWEVGQVVGLDPEAQIEKYAQVIVGARLPLSLGAFSYGHSAFNTGMKVGRYCSLSWNIDLIEGDHPMDWVSTSPVTHDPRDIRGLAVYLNDIGATEYQLESRPYAPVPAVLGHDVWIGMRALIRRGVTIGHGAVVGAGSVVTQDVPPYAIVAGTPARIVRYRFPEEQIARLLESQWWQYGPERLQQFNMREPDVFLDRLDAAVAEGLQPLVLPVLSGREIIAAGERI